MYKGKFKLFYIVRRKDYGTQKATGAVKNVHDSNAQYRGIKVFGGQSIHAGGIIVRQAGAKYKLGANVYEGNDFTIHASVDGVVTFSKKKVERFDGRKYLRTHVSVTPNA